MTATLAPVVTTTHAVRVIDAVDTATESTALAEARVTGDEIVWARRSGTDLVLGPRWTGAVDDPCAGCLDAVRPLAAPAAGFALPPGHDGVVAAVLGAGLAPGEVVTVTATGRVRRHRVVRDTDCLVCGTPGDSGFELQPRPACAGDPTRADASGHALADRADRATGGTRFGLRRRHVRLARAAMPLSEVVLHPAPGSTDDPPTGYGRGRTLREADAVATLEAWERSAGLPAAGGLVRGVRPDDLGDRALALPGLGTYSAEQYTAPRCRVRPIGPDTTLDWAPAHDLSTSATVLVPAETAYPWYRYPDAEQWLGDVPRRRHFLDSSSGTALGGGPEEASLHALLELIERDAFLLAWHARQPLTGIRVDSLTDDRSRLLAHLVEREGFTLHLLRATADVDVPVVWAVAVGPDGGTPASFSTAGAHPDPVQAVRSALWELAHQTGCGLWWDTRAVASLVADPWRVDTVADHWQRYTDPALLERVLACVGPAELTLTDAFPDWPQRFVRGSGGDLLGGVRFVAARLADAGLRQVLLVDQSTARHRAIGARVVRAIVPGLVPLTFGQANQRLGGLDRLRGAGTLDPHPFP